MALRKPDLGADVGFCDELVALDLSSLGMAVPSFWDEDGGFDLSSLAITLLRADLATVVDVLVVLGLLLLGLVLLELCFVGRRSDMMDELRDALN
jgi:hypothetical protein